MRHLLLLCMPAIFGMVFAGRIARQSQSSGEIIGNKPGPAIVQNHGAVGNPVAAAANIPQGGSSGQSVDYPILEGPPKTPNGPIVNQQHGYNGAPQVGAIPQNGGSSNDDGTGAGGALGGVLNPQIIPSGGGNSQDDGYDQQAYGGQGAAQGGAVAGGSSDSGYAAAAAGGGNGAAGGGNGAAGGGNGAAGGQPVADGTPFGAGGNPISGGSPARGAGNNGVDAPKAAPAYGGGEMQAENQALTQSGMSGGAIAGVVFGVAAVAAIGTGAAVYALKSGSSIPFSRA